MPRRIQRKRTKGWRAPEGAVYVGRGSEWGNPFVIGVDGDAAECVELYADYMLPYRHRGENSGIETCLLSMANYESILTLKGKTLMCWCAENGPPCHGDWLLRMANG